MLTNLVIQSKDSQDEPILDSLKDVNFAQGFRELLAANINSPLSKSFKDEKVLKAARYIVSKHNNYTPIELSAFDVPHKALLEISEKLDDLGVSHEVSQSLMEALRQYVLESGGSFARTANAKPIAIHLIVQNTVPKRKFKNSVTELAFIGQKQARVEGMSSINVRLTTTGTATTSNAADVDAMFSGVKELGLWMRFEAPTKEDLDELMDSMEARLTGTIQAVGGVMNSDDLKKLIETLKNGNSLSPQIDKIISNLIKLQEALNNKGEKIDQQAIKDILKETTLLLSDHDFLGLLPPVLIDAALNTLQSLSSYDIVQKSLIENGFEYLVVAENNKNYLAVIEGAIDELVNINRSETLDPEVLTKINELIELTKQKLLEGELSASVILSSITEGLTKINSLLGADPAIINPLNLVLENLTANNIVRNMAVQMASLPEGSIEAAQLQQVMDVIAKNPEILRDPVFVRDVTIGVPQTGTRTGFEILSSAVLSTKGTTPLLPITTVLVDRVRLDIREIIVPSSKAEIPKPLVLMLKSVDNVVTKLITPPTGSTPTVNKAVVAVQMINKAITNPTLSPVIKTSLEKVRGNIVNLVPETIRKYIQPALKNGPCGPGCKCGEVQNRVNQQNQPVQKVSIKNGSSTISMKDDGGAEVRKIGENGQETVVYIDKKEIERDTRIAERVADDFRQKGYANNVVSENALLVAMARLRQGQQPVSSGVHEHFNGCCGTGTPASYLDLTDTSKAENSYTTHIKNTVDPEKFSKKDFENIKTDIITQSMEDDFEDFNIELPPTPKPPQPTTM